MTGVWVALSALINALIIGFFARRLLGVPVGWPRTIVLSLGVNFAIGFTLDKVVAALGLTPLTGHQVSSPAEFFIVLLVILWILVIEVMLLAILEALWPTGTGPHLITFTRQMPARWRRARRYWTILRIAAKYGLGMYLRPRARASGVPAETVARSLREAFTEAGVTFVKLGQMLSTRPDLLPKPFVDELSRLHSNVPPEPWESVRPIIEEELGASVDDVFAEIDPVPMAAASVGQIHAARLKDGSEVVVKVQRSAARAQVTADLDIVQRLARIAARRADWARDLDVLALVDGFSTSLNEELDYRVELANMQAVAAASPALHVPRPYPRLSGQRVLVMEWVGGVPLSAADDILRGIDAERRTELAETLFAAVLRQVLDRGVFHADLHPGNILIDSGGTLTLLDFGSVGRLDKAGRDALSLFLLAVDRQDGIAATDALIDLLGAPEDDRALEQQVGQLIARYGGGFGAGGSAQLFADLFAVVLEHRLSVPPPIAAAFRALGALEGSLLTLTHDLDIVAIARTESKSLIRERFSPREVRGELEVQLASILPLLRRLPRRVGRIAEEVQQGSFTVNVRAFAHREDRAFVTGIVQQLVVALLAAALGIGGILLAISEAGPVIAGGITLFTYLGFLLLLFAFVLGSRALVLVFRQSSGRE